jgi:hypothetical protein
MATQIDPVLRDSAKETQDTITNLCQQLDQISPLSREHNDLIKVFTAPMLIDMLNKLENPTETDTNLCYALRVYIIKDTLQPYIDRATALTQVTIS